MRMRTIAMACALFGLMMALGCSENNAPGNGTLKIRLVDSPGAYDEVNIVVESVEVHTSGADSTGGWHMVNAIPGTYDLLRLRNGLSALLVDEQLPAGDYTQIRLKLGAGSTVVVGGVSHPLTIPSGMTSGLKLNHNFTIDSDALYELTLDFDVSRSIHQTGNGQYKMKPVIGVTAHIVSGSLYGVVMPVEARAAIMAVSGMDTVIAWADTLSGAFRFQWIREGFYDVTITPTAGGYQDEFLAAVLVTRHQDTDLGTITLLP